MSKIKVARITPKKGGISYFPGFVGDVVLAEAENTSFELSLWKDEGKPASFVLSGFDNLEDAYVGVEISPEELDNLCEQLQKAKALLLEEADEA